jgi:uncharacterized membrane protein
MRFTDPWWLLLLIPAGVGLWYSFRLVHGMAKSRKRLAFVIRFLLAGCLIFALSGPESRRANHGVATMFLLDRSDSIKDEESARAEKFIDAAMQRLGPDDVAGLVAFGKEAIIDTAPGGRRTLGQVLSKVDGSASDLAGAIRLASATFPDGKSRRIVILSDGNETSGDAFEAAQVAATDGITIDSVPLGIEDRQSEASVVDLIAPGEARVDQPFDMRVIVDSTTAAKGTLEIDRDGKLVKTVPVTLTPGRNAIVVSEKLDQAGFSRYRATLRLPNDRDPRNNLGMGFVSVKGKPRILVMQESPARQELVQALQKSGIDVDLGGPGGLPTRAEQIQRYDAVIFNDINAASITETQMKLMQSAVRDSGVGFAMIGGENSFLPGGYYGTPIADILPVDLNIRQRKTFPSTSVLIVIDCSGSMSMVEDGVQKLRMAAKAAEETVKLMAPTDRVGVAGSTDGIEFVAPMQPLTDKMAVINQIRRIAITGGGIYIGPSVQSAEPVLLREPSKVRHFILLADGNDSTDWRDAIPRVAGMRANHITTTVIAIGNGKDVPMLRQLALAGGGRFYLATKARQLPAIFTQDAAIMSRSAIEEGKFFPKVTGGEEVLRGIDSLPPLLAYCLTDARPLSKVGMRTHKDDPLLASWQYGLATTLAFTSDAQSRWAQAWVGWEGFNAFWSQAARSISRRATRNNYQVSVRQEGGKGVIELKGYDRLGNPLTSENATVRIAMPNGQSKEVNLSQQAPGVYEGQFEASDLGSYVVTVAEKDPYGGVRVSSSGFSVPYPPEYRSFRPNRPLLAQMTKVGHGKELKEPAEALRPVENPGESISELWPLLVFLAALLLPIDVGVRRLAIPLLELLSKVWARFRSRKEAPVPQTEVVGRLQQVKQRVRTELPTGEDQPKPEAPIRPGPAPAERRQSPAKTGVSAGSSLLEARRKRSGSDQKD